MFLFKQRVTGSVNFDSREEGEVLQIEYPTAADPMDSRVKILGDNSLLLKYTNPHMVLVVTRKTARSQPVSSRGGPGGPGGAMVVPEDGSTTAAAAAGGGDSGGGDSGGDSGDSNSASGESSLEDGRYGLHVTLIDTVSSQVVYRSFIADGTTPVAAAIVENNVFVSYWSTAAHRTELSSLALFEGMIDKSARGPFSAGPVTAHASSFNAIPPIGD